MKKIVVAIDFSTSSETIMNYAAQLAKQTGTSISLLHVYQVPVGIGDMPVLMVSVEEVKKNVDENLSEIKEAFQKNYPELAVEVDGRLGDIVEELNVFCKEADPAVVIIGTNNFSGVEKLLFGNTALSIIRHCDYPVIAVPQNAKIAVPGNIVLATDLLNVADVPAAKIISIVQMLHATLHVVHVRENEEDSEEGKEKLLQALSVVHPAFHSVTDEDVLRGLQTYVQENNIDLLLSLPHRHNLYERLFFKLHTDGLIGNMPVPVMCMRGS